MELMETGMGADYRKISELTKKVNQVVTGCKKVKVVNKAGTELNVEFHPSSRWKVSDGPPD
jgi:leucyl aminopeptidase (aminopeptidase T)